MNTLKPILKTSNLLYNKLDDSYTLPSQSTGNKNDR